MRIPIVAIIGLPNVGKSTFFNKVLHQYRALTHHEAGTTRDRHYGVTEWNGLNFYLVDTAGINNRPDSELEKNIQKQTELALDEADLVILMNDGKTDPGSIDYQVASRLKKSDKPVILAVNKIEVRNAKTLSKAEAYTKLGLGKPFPVSAVNGSGIGDLLDEIVLKLRKKFEKESAEFEGYLKIAFIGKPNVGKSSLINALLKQPRLLVDKKAGTTRSTVEIPFVFEDKKFLLIDTAGVKRKWKQEVDVETAAAMQSLRTLSHTDVALFVLDASSEITAQDQILANLIMEQSKSVVVVLNKTDLLTQEQKDNLLDQLPSYFPMLWWVPVVFTSAQTGEGLEQMLNLAFQTHEAGLTELSQEELDKFLEDILEKHMPGKMDDERKPKIYNLKQVSNKPITIKVTVNFPSAIAPAWKKLLEKQFRIKFGLMGAPILFRYIRRS